MFDTDDDTRLSRLLSRSTGLQLNTFFFLVKFSMLYVSLQCMKDPFSTVPEKCFWKFVKNTFVKYIQKILKAKDHIGIMKL